MVRATPESRGASFAGQPSAGVMPAGASTDGGDVGQPVSFSCERAEGDRPQLACATPAICTLLADHARDFGVFERGRTDRRSYARGGAPREAVGREAGRRRKPALA